MRPALASAEIEFSILDIVEALEGETERFDTVANLAARAEADYKLRLSRAVVDLADTQARMTAQERQARAELQAEKELREWKVLEARKQATKEALLSLRARLDALRSLAANVRHQT